MMRGKRYQAARQLVDQTKLYPAKEAIKLAKKTSISKFVGKLEAHLVVDKIGQLGEVKLPYAGAREKKVVVADEKVLTQIKAGKIDFDVLLASPKMMPKLLPYARLLGPRGLMPNPKNGTLVADPEKAKARFSQAGLSLKTEKKAPVLHLVLGSLDQADEQLLANLEAVLQAVRPHGLKKVVLAATMGPAIKVKLD